MSSPNFASPSPPLSFLPLTRHCSRFSGQKPSPASGFTATPALRSIFSQFVVPAGRKEVEILGRRPDGGSTGVTVCFSLPSRYSFGTRERRNPSLSTRGRRDSRTPTWRFDCSSSRSSLNSVNKASFADIHTVGQMGRLFDLFFSSIHKKKSHIKKGEAHLKPSHHFQSFSSRSELHQSSVAKRKEKEF